MLKEVENYMNILELDTIKPAKVEKKLRKEKKRVTQKNEKINQSSRNIIQVINTGGSLEHYSRLVGTLAN